MSKIAALKGLLALAIVCGCVAPAVAQVSVAQVLTIKPKTDEIVFTTPTPAEIGKCTVEIIKTPGGGSGYLLSDGGKLPVRKFLDTDGDGRVDSWSFFRDGVEVYRENLVGKGYSFRWMGAGGMKWGTGTVNGAGKAQVESWRMISAEEAAAEAFAALQTGDFDRFKALLITPQEMQALGLPAAETQRLTALQAGAPAKFQKIRGAIASLPQAKFSRLENAQPGAFPADVTGGAQDIIKANGLILFENPNAAKKHDWLQSYDIVQIGNAWRLTDVPSPDIAGPVDNDALVKLAEIDGRQPQGKDPKFGNWTLERVQQLKTIAELPATKDKDNWYKQIFDSLATAVTNDHAVANPVLTQWKDSIEKAMPGSNLAAYGAYRELWANFQLEMSKTPPAKMQGVQDAYHAKLEKFIEAYPKSGDTPDAMYQLATGSEFGGKDDLAKKWYKAIATEFPGSNNAAKATGSIRRLDAVGQPMEVAGQTLSGTPYKLTPGKITVVYYWASYSTQATGDFATLAKLQSTFGKDLDIVTVNLDDKAEDANNFIARSPLKTLTLHQPGTNGGMDSPLATHYGIFGLPHLFLVDRDGKVVSNKAQANNLEDEINRITKK
ncbi:MAG: thioredoxin-like domain-containing protein [Planctomycetota bacterium]